MKALMEQITKLYKRYDFLNKKDELILFVLKSLLVRILADQNKIELSKNNSKQLKQSFTFQTILGLWANRDLTGDGWPRERSIALDKPLWTDVEAFLDQSAGMLKNKTPARVLSDAYQTLLKRNHRKSRGIFYTPSVIGGYMSELALADKDDYSELKVIDIACGCGVLLDAVYDAVMSRVPPNEKSKRHQELLTRGLWGFDTDPLAVLVTRLTLILKGDEYICPEHIVQADGLAPLKEKDTFDIIIGNPPYIGHKEVDSEYIHTIKERYAAVYSDKSDLSYCFFQQGYEVLKPGGRLVFLTSRYFYEAYYAQKLRRFITTHFAINDIIDFNGLRVIEGAGIDPTISIFTKGAAEDNQFNVYRFKKTAAHFQDTSVYIEDLERGTQKTYESFTLKSRDLSDTLWRLNNPLETQIVKKIEDKSPFTLGDMVRSFQGIITGCDKAFILNAEEAAAFPRELCHPWIKSRHLQAFFVEPTDMQLLYTNGIKTIEDYPKIIHRLESYAEKLGNRRETKKGKLPWYALQWSRDPSLFTGKKILYPYKSKDNRFSVDRNGLFFSADIYGMVLKDLLYINISEEILTLLLNTKLYTFYFQSFAKKMGYALYEYYPNTLNKLKIPDLSSELIHQLSEIYAKIEDHNTHPARKSDRVIVEQLAVADDLLAKAFDLSKEERQVIINSGDTE